MNPDNRLFDTEIERTTRALRKQARERRRELVASPIVLEDMAVNRIEGNPLPPPPRAKTLREYLTPNMDGCGRSIVISPILADNFQLKPALIQLVQQNQFGGHDSEDPRAHIVEFLQICDTVKLNEVSEDAIKLMLSPFL